MNIKKTFRIVFIISLIMVFLSGIGLVNAATSSELRKQQSDIDKQIEETNSEIAGVKDQMTDQLNQISELNAEISTYQTDIYFDINGENGLIKQI